MPTTTNLGLNTPVNGDPAYTNAWAGTIVNPNMGLIDDYTAGGVTVAVGGNINVVLTYTDSASCQARQSDYIFTGVLTGNIVVLWPNGHDFNFSCRNQTTGSFTLSLGVNNGSGAPAGTTSVLATDGNIYQYRSDGTNVLQRGGGTGAVTFPISIPEGGTGQTTQSTGFNALAPTSNKGDMIVSNGSNNVALAVGNNGYVLTADSTQSKGVKWAPNSTISSPVILANGTINNGANGLNLVLSAYTGYNRIEIDIDNLITNVATGPLEALFSSNGGNSYLTANYIWSYASLGSSYGYQSSASDASISLDGPTISIRSCKFDLYNANNASQPMTLHGTSLTGNLLGGSAIPITYESRGTNASAGINAIRFRVTGSATVVSGTYRIIGYP